MYSYYCAHAREFHDKLPTEARPRISAYQNDIGIRMGICNEIRWLTLPDKQANTNLAYVQAGVTAWGMVMSQFLFL